MVLPAKKQFLRTDMNEKVVIVVKQVQRQLSFSHHLVEKDNPRQCYVAVCTMSAKVVSF